MRQDVLLWSLIAAAALGTFCLRFSFIALLEKISEPESFRRALKYIPAAVMSALVSSSLLVRGDELALGLDNLRLQAGIVAAVVGYLSRSLLWTIVSGLLALLALTHVFGPSA